MYFDILMHNCVRRSFTSPACPSTYTGFFLHGTITRKLIGLECWVLNLSKRGHTGLQLERIGCSLNHSQIISKNNIQHANFDKIFYFHFGISQGLIVRITRSHS